MGAKITQIIFNLGSTRDCFGMMDSERRIVVFAVGDTRCAIHLDVAERVLPMIAVTPLPGAPAITPGAINLHGDAVAVVDLRRRFGFPPRDHGLSGRLLIARLRQRRVALPVDEVVGVARLQEGSISSPDGLLPGLRHVSGVVATPDGLLFIHDLESFLSLEEEARLDVALQGWESGKP